jgi:hypothetical protein
MWQSNGFEIIRNDDADGLRAYLSANPHRFTLRFRDTDGTILHYAAQVGSIDCLRELIHQWGLDVNDMTWGRRSRHRARTQENTSRQTPLHYACIHGRAPCAEALCQAGANLDVADEDGNTPLSHALLGGHRGHRRVVMTLLRAGAYQPFPEFAPLHNAALDLARAVERAGDWAAYVAQHKRVLAGLVTKCRPMPDDAAGLVVEFMCPPGGF